MQLSVQFLAGPELRIDQRRAVLTITRPLLLLSYLVYQETWVSRDELLALFWPEAREAKARQSLRALLYSCKKEPYSQALELEKSRVRCLAATDVHAFREAIARGDWQLAVNRYGGTFLEQVRGDDSAAFETWLAQTRDELHVAWRDAALHVAAQLSAEGRHGEAAQLLGKVLRYDFSDEDVVQACMKALASAGQKRRP